MSESDEKRIEEEAIKAWPIIRGEDVNRFPRLERIAGAIAECEYHQKEKKELQSKLKERDELLEQAINVLDGLMKNPDETQFLRAAARIPSLLTRYSNLKAK